MGGAWARRMSRSWIGWSRGSRCAGMGGCLLRCFSGMMNEIGLRGYWVMGEFPVLRTERNGVLAGRMEVWGQKKG